MSCNDIASVLDTHRATRLAPAERAKIDAHLAACADCSAAWHAQGELLALRRRYLSENMRDGLRRWRFHELRLTYGTRMIAQADSRRVQEWRCR